MQAYHEALTIYNSRNLISRLNPRMPDLRGLSTTVEI